jgi:hypothetical protein
MLWIEDDVRGRFRIANDRDAPTRVVRRAKGVLEVTGIWIYKSHNAPSAL